MATIMDTATILEPQVYEYDTNNEPVYTVEEAFDRIDKTFIEFYGEYGRKIVNTRRKEWNEDGNWNFKPL